MSIKLIQTDGGKTQEGFVNETNDCAVRALAIAGNMPYAKAHDLLKKQGRRDRRGIEVHIIERAAKSAGLIWEPVKIGISDGFYGVVYPTLAEITRILKSGRYYIVTDSHAMALIDGVIYDTGQISGPRSRIKQAWKVSVLEDKVQHVKPSITQNQINELWERLNRLEAR